MPNRFLLFSFLVFLFHGVGTAAQDDITNIGAIINVNSRIGKEEKISMEIAVKEFDVKHKLVLHVRDSGGDPLQAFTAAGELIKEKQVQAIIGMETWKEASLVNQVADREKVPLLSFSAPSITPPLASVRWPYLIRMASNNSQQIQCVASIVGFYEWRRVIAIYEDDGYNSDRGSLSLLSNALGAVGTEIEHWLAFPPFSSLTNPKQFIHKELEKVMITQQSRVFIIVRSSLELATHVLTEAKDIGIMGRDSVWITTDSVTNLLDTVNSTIMSSMQGLIGIKTQFTDKGKSFLSFSTKFRTSFRSLYPEEEKSEPGIYALRAYDAISTVAIALENPTRKGTLLDNILSANFSGLSGNIQFQNEEISHPPTYEIINVVGKSYKVLKQWSPDHGISDGENFKVVYWPGGLERVPLGWAMPSVAKPMIIGVPGRTSFEKFVKWNDGDPDPKGFCIDVFKRVVELIGYTLPHEFQKFDGLYDDLVDQVYFKKFDAVVGDITILANRTNYVEFTQPYAESGLTMVVPVKPESRDWLFVKPFTPAMWFVVTIVFVYTMLVVWFLEHGSNPEFGGPRKTQLSTAMWFTFSTLFFAHKENLRSNYTRAVMVIWLFVVFVVTSSYQASLTSMLTVQRLVPTVMDINTLVRTGAPVGCDGDSFVRKYMEKVLKFHPDNIKNISSEYDYPEELKSGRIKAAFLELPYEKVFLSQYCKDFYVAGTTYRFGGLSFVFPKGSPMARDFSRVFLELSENGGLDELEKKWFPPSPECSNLDDNMENKSLSLSNFWTLFLVTGLTSTIMLIFYIFRHYIKHQRHFVPVTGILTEYGTPGHPESTPASEIEMPETYIADTYSQTRALRLANSLPTLDNHSYQFTSENPKWRHVPRST